MNDLDGREVVSEIADVLKGRARWCVAEGDSLEVLPRLPDGSISMICTDPPYSWGFMQAKWDSVLPDPAIWRECLRVLKPGGSMIAMSGSRLDCLWRVCRDIEGAGFELSQTAFVWVTRSGFPKGQDLSKAADAKAFRAWLDSVDHGLSAAEVRQVTSAAVGGVYSRDMTGEHGTFYYEGIGQEHPHYEAQRNGTATNGARLLSSLLARHWHPLSEADKWAAWEGQGEADLERPPGMRVVTRLDAELAKRIGTKMDNPVPMSQVNCIKRKIAESGVVPITAPSTALARRLECQYSKGKVKPAWELCIWARKPISEKTELANVVRDRKSVV